MYLFEEKKIKKYVSINQEVIQLIEEGFTKLANNEVTLPPIMRIDIPEHNGEVDVKSAYIKGEDSFAIKISSGFFNNYLLGLPSLGGLMMLFSSKTGLPEAILLDNGYLTDVRTAAAGAVAANHLAKASVDCVGVIGTGMQARVQMEALYKVRPFKQIMVYGRKQERTEKYVRDMEKSLGVKVVQADSIEEVVKESEIVVTTTPSTEPLIKGEWLHPGLHITAMGSDTEHKRELASDCFQKADIICCDVKKQVFRLGELHHVIRDGIVTKEDERIIELGEITLKRKFGRTNDQQITICDLTGTGVQDTVCASYAFNHLKQAEISIR